MSHFCSVPLARKWVSCLWVIPGGAQIQGEEGAGDSMSEFGEAESSAWERQAPETPSQSSRVGPSEAQAGQEKPPEVGVGYE